MTAEWLSCKRYGRLPHARCEEISFSYHRHHTSPVIFSASGRLRRGYVDICLTDHQAQSELRSRELWGKMEGSTDELFERMKARLSGVGEVSQIVLKRQCHLVIRELSWLLGWPA